MIKIVAIMTVFNRAATTESCLVGLFNQVGLGTEFELAAVVVDDGSSDSTPEMLRRLSTSYPIEVVRSSGDLYWAAGMQLAQDHAISTSPDALLWVNDDVDLDGDSIIRALDCFSGEPLPIVIGATTASDRTSLTYTASRLRSARPGSLSRVTPGMGAEAVDAFNGNFVLVPRHAYEALGTVDGRFQHGYGDIDYGLRARRAGLPVVLMPGTVGRCDFNPTKSTWRDPSVPRRQRLSGLFGRKGYPLASHWRFNLRHGGFLGPVFASSTYVKAIGRIMLKKTT